MVFASGELQSLSSTIHRGTQISTQGFSSHRPHSGESESSIGTSETVQQE